jgi:hypothetical protein
MFRVETLFKLLAQDAEPEWGFALSRAVSKIKLPPSATHLGGLIYFILYHSPFATFDIQVSSLVDIPQIVEMELNA